jgi:hypothetical protein
MDDGDVALQVLDVSGREGPSGRWLDEPTVSGGEHHLRWPDLARFESWGLHPAQARVVRHGVASSPLPIEDGCAA